MKHWLVIVNLALVAFSTNAWAQTNAAAATPAPATAPATPPKHKPIIFNAPADSGTSGAIRVGGGSRGGLGDAPELRVLVPDATGLTTQAQPSFYMYLSKPAKTFLEITVTEPKHAKPLFAQKTPVTTQSGILAIRLAKYNVTLKQGIIYKWSVAVVMDPEKRSGDVIANGVVKRVEPTPELTSQLAQASDADKAAVYANNGIWYDALQSISEQIGKSPADDSLKQERIDLLKQAKVDVSGLDGASN